MNLTLPPSKPYTPLPLGVRLDSNKFAGRIVLEGLGYFPLALATERNNYRRLELTFDFGYWLLAGFAISHCMERFYSANVSNAIRQKQGLPVLTGKEARQHSLLHLPFELVEQSQALVKDAQGAWTPRGKELLKQASHQLQIAEPELEKLLNNTKFRRQLNYAKAGVAFLDLAILAIKGQTYPWISNWLTEKISKKKGFSGTFNYTTNEYRSKEATEYEKNKKRNQLISAGLGFGAAAAVPLVLLTALEGKGRFAKKMKSLLPNLNYAEAVYMPKPIFFVHTLFNYNLSTLFGCRALSEFREKLARCAGFDFFYYIGDEMIKGQVAKLLEWWEKKQGNVLETSITHDAKVLGKTMKHARSMSDVYHELLAKGHTDPTKTKAYQHARTSCFTGIVSSGVAMGAVLPILTNLFTYKAVTEDQKKFYAQKHQTIPQKTIRKSVSV